MRPLPIALVLLVAATLTPARADKRRDDKKERTAAPAPPDTHTYTFEADDIEGDLGATPGGAKDIGFFRDRVAAGEIPNAAVITPEGLFSEHDLPLKTGKGCTQLFCVVGEGTDAHLLVEPDVRYLAQLGFTSGLQAKSFKRQPLSLIAVIDKSGSMSGHPLALVKESLLQVVAQLGPKDQLAIVLYGDRSYVHLAPTAGSRKAELTAAIGRIESAGSTDMESGLAVGFALAHKTAPSFQGTTRVMLFTDERPNVGRTDARSFMAMAETASRAGIGMTTIGVGEQFGAELATRVASVRGGNLLFFADLDKMKKTFTEDLDTLVTELAYDMDLVVAPAPGLKIAGVYGVPGQALTWTQGGAVRLKVATIFLSKRKGAIFVALASAGSTALPTPVVPDGQPLAVVNLAYTKRGAARVQTVVSLTRVAAASLGLRRGFMLVDEATALRQAATLHHEKNDQEGAYQLVHALASLYRQTSDADLASERTLTAMLERTLAKLSGHQGEPDPGAVTVAR